MGVPHLADRTGLWPMDGTPIWLMGMREGTPHWDWMEVVPLLGLDGVPPSGLNVGVDCLPFMQGLFV